jgi:hypothetical protein
MPTIRCPYCEERIPADATRCPECRERLPDDEPVESVRPAPRGPSVRQGEPPTVRPVRARDDDYEDEEPRSRRRRSIQRGKYADCPGCGNPGDASPVGFTWWGGLLGPKLLSHVRCRECGVCYNGKSGNYNTTGITIYVVITGVIGLMLACAGILASIKGGR